MFRIHPLLSIIFISVLCTSLYVVYKNNDKVDKFTPPGTLNAGFSWLDSVNANTSEWQDSILIFKSNFYDIEQYGDIVQTVYTTSIHVFDFHKKIITRKILKDETWVIASYDMNEFYKQTGLAATTYVFTINDNEVKEIWFCPYVPNLGYDYIDGSRLACYEIKQIQSMP